MYTYTEPASISLVFQMIRAPGGVADKSTKRVPSLLPRLFNEAAHRTAITRQAGRMVSESGGI